MKITPKDQVASPQEIREKVGALPDTEVELVVPRGARIVRAMRGRATVRMSTDEVMKLTRG